MDENIIKIKQEQQTKNYIILLEKQIIKLSEKIKKIETKSSFHQNNKQLRNEIEQLKMSNINYPETPGQEIKNLKIEINYLKIKNNELNAENKVIRNKLTDMKRYNTTLKKSNTKIMKTNNDIKKSNSWKITKPLRLFKKN